MKLRFLPIFTLMTLSLPAQKEIPLYDVVPNNKLHQNKEKSETGSDGIVRVSGVTVPVLYKFTPAPEQKPDGTAIIICPGGGYSILAITHEGFDVAKALNEWGITAFVLKYRLPDSITMMDRSIAPLQDAERAIQLVRQQATAWGISSRKIGIMGFSAGGHLAASLSTRYHEELIVNPKHISLRPDFSVLIYPVISFTGSLAHTGSRDNLLGKKPSSFRISKYSNELQVNKKTPPAFLVHAMDDATVPYKNSVLYYQALKKNRVDASIILSKEGGHGFGMNNKTTDEKWMNDLRAWLIKQGFLKP